MSTVKILVWIIFCMLSLFSPAFCAVRKYNEAMYVDVWCKAQGGMQEFVNSDYTRVDCLTAHHAVEFDFANKWAESIGQALHYQCMTGKRAKVVLILERPEKQMVYYRRVKKLAEIYDFDVEYVTPEIFCAN